MKFSDYLFAAKLAVLIGTLWSGPATACDVLQLATGCYQQQQLAVVQPAYQLQQVQYQVAAPLYVQQQRGVQYVQQPAYVQQQVVLKQRAPIVLRQRAQVLRQKTVIRPERRGVGRLLFGR